MRGSLGGTFKLRKTCSHFGISVHYFLLLQRFNPHTHTVNITADCGVRMKQAVELQLALLAQRGSTRLELTTACCTSHGMMRVLVPAACFRLETKFVVGQQSTSVCGFTRTCIKCLKPTALAMIGEAAPVHV
jgi:hypothetical protein